MAFTRVGLAALALTVSSLPTGAVAAQAPPTAPRVVGLPLEGAAAEVFLREAKVVARKPLGTGITRSERLTLSDGKTTCRAVWKTINERRMGMSRMENGGYEFDFRDSWKGEVASYELDKLLGLGLVPPTVERRIDGRIGSLQMWVEGVMTEADRREKGLEAPDAEAWNAQMHKIRLLHQLTYDTDRQNIRNVLVSPTFRLYAIDFSRAFRIQSELLAPEELQRFSRAVLERLTALDRPTVEARLGKWLQKLQIDGLMARRDLILALVKERIAEKGEAAVLYP